MSKPDFGNFFDQLEKEKVEDKTTDVDNTPTTVEEVKVVEPTVPVKTQDPNDIVEKTFMSILGEYYGTRYDFNLNYKFYVAYFDGETPTRLPRFVMEYLEKKLDIMDRSRRLLPESELMEKLY